MKFEPRWIKERVLGKGGQGEVFLVREETSEYHKRVKELFNLWPTNGAIMYEDEREKRQKQAAELLAQVVDNRMHPNNGALKVLHRDEDARDPARSRERAAREIKAMRTWQHSNLLALKDCDGDELWYVSELHEGGPLDQQLKNYQGDLIGALTAVRPLVAGVALLHGNGVIHRDIKPHNIFLARDGRLVLGDFGLIYVPDLENNRLSATHSNVGTHAWMPGWAMDHRVTELKPTFDVFSLGKVIWSMVSGKPSLTLWYYDKPQNNLETQYPDRKEMRVANELFSKCIVEDEARCISSAGQLLEEIDAVVERLSKGPNFFESPRKTCKVCHLGEYKPATPREARNLGVNPGGEYVLQIYACDRCRNIELFYFDGSNPPPEWKET